MTRRVGVLTTSRADYGICLPILRAIEACDGLRLHLLVSGTHLSPEFGMSTDEILRDGFEVAERVEIVMSSDTPQGTATSMGLATLGFSQVFRRDTIDLLLVVGDRFEVHAAVSACVPFGIPVAHVHGGEITQGAIDDVLRHSITKMSHLHFATTSAYAARIAQMGEEEWRICVSGAPGLDNLHAVEVPSLEELSGLFGVDLSRPTLLATYHPPTRHKAGEEAGVTPMLNAIRRLGLQVVFTYPNADAGGRSIIAEIEAFGQSYADALVAVNASQPAYFGLMRHAAAMVGNSSSGIIEAASFGLPVVNIGSRQAGRIRAANVIDVDNDEEALVAGIERAVSPEFRDSLRDLENPYGDGAAGGRIVDVLSRTELDDRLLRKAFVDLPAAVTPSRAE